MMSLWWVITRGGIHGNEHPDTDPIWSIGWDHRSLILMLLDGGKWRAFRLPKATHTYDGAHGWNTEWPRIRDVGEDDLLMTMHGTFWRFPRTFSAASTAGIRPRSTYLKVIGDFTRWNDRLVFGCDDTAKSEFLNTRKAKGTLAGPGQSHSNLWFADPSLPDKLGPASGTGGVWVNDVVKGGEWSDPFLFAGYDRYAAMKLAGAYRRIPGLLRENVIRRAADLMPTSELRRSRARSLSDAAAVACRILRTPSTCFPDAENPASASTSSAIPDSSATALRSRSLASRSVPAPEGRSDRCAARSSSPACSNPATSSGCCRAS